MEIGTQLRANTVDIIETKVSFAFVRGRTRQGHFGIHETVFPVSDEG